MQREAYENEESGFSAADLREGLILAGIKELENQGLGGFSLRRVAAAAGVSCAAPYKHFKDKEALLAAIFSYINEKWSLLEEHICALYEDEHGRCIVELCLAAIRFWIGNPHFRSVHMMEKGEGERREDFGFGHRTAALLSEWAEERKMAKEEKAEMLYTVRSLLSGAVMLLADGYLDNDPATFLMLRRSFEKAIGISRG